MKVIELRWEGPFSLDANDPRALFKSTVANESGIYVWTVATPAGQLIQYVGETEDTFAARHGTHLRYYNTGRYTIHRAESFRMGRKDPVYVGYRWSKKRRQNCLSEFRARREELRQALAAMLEVIEVFVAPLDADQRARRRIETAIVQCLQKHGAQEGEFLDEGLNLWRPVPGETPIQVTTECPVPFRGLTAEITA